MHLHTKPARCPLTVQIHPHEPDVFCAKQHSCHGEALSGVYNPYHKDYQGKETIIHVPIDDRLAQGLQDHIPAHPTFTGSKDFLDHICQ